MNQFGPRPEKFLDAWATTVNITDQGNGFDFISPTRSDVLERKLEVFLDD